MAGYPRIRVGGTPFERGRQYGEQASQQVAHSRRGYEESFAQKGISWQAALEQAAPHGDAIRASFPEIWQEIEGIAAGSGWPVADILALNCRTEILWSAYTAAAAPGASAGSECSSFAVAPSHTRDGNTLLRQNWDWLVHAFESVVVLEVEREDGPNYVTIVEAGLLGKTMLNSAGLWMCVNTLVTTRDGHAPGIPFHVMLRALADAEHVFDAVEMLAAHQRASSGNYVLASADGAILNVEVEPGGPEGVHPVLQVHGRTAHTNHFLSALHSGSDLAPLAMSDSYVRLARLHQSLGESGGVGVHELEAALKDHSDFPGSICCHPDPRSPAPSQWASIMSVIMDVGARTLHLAEGNPCSTERRTWDYSDFLGEAAGGAQHPPRVAS